MLLCRHMLCVCCGVVGVMGARVIIVGVLIYGGCTCRGRAVGMLLVLFLRMYFIISLVLCVCGFFLSVRLLCGELDGVAYVGVVVDNCITITTGIVDVVMYVG